MPKPPTPSGRRISNSSRRVPAGSRRESSRPAGAAGEGGAASIIEVGRAVAPLHRPGCGFLKGKSTRWSRLARAPCIGNESCACLPHGAPDPPTSNENSARSQGDPGEREGHLQGVHVRRRFNADGERPVPGQGRDPGARRHANALAAVPRPRGLQDPGRGGRARRRGGQGVDRRERRTGPAVAADQLSPLD